jgi:hypothetical protein
MLSLLNFALEYRIGKGRENLERPEMNETRQNLFYADDVNVLIKGELTTDRLRKKNYYIHKW